MRQACFLLLFIILCSCNNGADHTARLQAQADSLKHNVKDSYKPGLGEFMTGIQLHHAKLWFAGDAGNWPLADFELHEITETLDDIKKYCDDRPEVKSIGMIDRPIDSLTTAVGAKDGTAFKRAYTLLTATCNDCHKAVHHEFNVIKTPDTPPVSNQVFKAN